MTSIPKAFNYSQFKPTGFMAKNRVVRFKPQSSYGNIGINDTIRFQINAPGYWDPYHSYINIEIDAFGADPSTEPSNYFKQLDSSAHSFINEMITYVSGSEIERISEYDTLAAILNDMNYSPEQRASRLYEGMGFSHHSKIVDFPAEQSQALFLKFDTSKRKTYNSVVQPGILAQTSVGPRPYVINKGNFKNSGITSLEFYSPVGTDTYKDTANYSFTKLPTHFWKGCVDLLHASSNVSPGFLNVERADLCMLTLNNETLLTANKETVVATTESDLITGMLEPDSGGYSTYSQGMDTSTRSVATGYVPKLFSHSLSGGCFEKQFSKYSWVQTVDGKLGQYAKSSLGSFSIPIINGVFGVLMPMESYRFIPLSAFENLIFEFRMNKYALFSSGYTNDGTTISEMTDIIPFNTIKQLFDTTSNVGSRTYKITKFEIVAELLEFDSKEIDSITEAQLENGIILHTNSWYNGPYFYLANTAAVQGTFQVNLSFESMKALIFCFISEDYRTYNFCRKQYRLSRNITFLQFKIGVDYYPSQPIEGHAGNPTLNSSSGVNSEFIINLFKAFGKLHDVLGDCLINPENFAVNERPYNPTFTSAFLNSTGSVVNANTAMGMPGYWENACVGRSVYGMNFETLNKDVSFMSGINTTKSTPFEISLKVDSQSVNSSYDRPATMYIFCLYDFLLSLTGSSVRVIGRG